jgi:hypothetical protein
MMKRREWLLRSRALPRFSADMNRQLEDDSSHGDKRLTMHTAHFIGSSSLSVMAGNAAHVVYFTPHLFSFHV